MSNQFAVDRLKAQAQMQLPGALDGPLIMAIFGVVADFCIKTNTLHEEQDITTRVDKRDYEVSASESDLYYTKLLSLVRNDQETDQRLLSNPTQHRAYMLNPGVMRLHNTPDQIFRLTAKFAMAPRPTDNFGSLPNIPDAFWDMYHAVLLEGLLASMMGQVAKPYSNERMGIFHGRRFIAGCSTAKVEAYNGGLLGGQNWRFPSFGGRNRGPSGWGG